MHHLVVIQDTESGRLYIAKDAPDAIPAFRVYTIERSREELDQLTYAASRLPDDKARAVILADATEITDAERIANLAVRVLQLFAESRSEYGDR